MNSNSPLLIASCRRQCIVEENLRYVMLRNGTFVTFPSLTLLFTIRQPNRSAQCSWLGPSRLPREKNHHPHDDGAITSRMVIFEVRNPYEGKNRSQFGPIQKELNCNQTESRTRQQVSTMPLLIGSFFQGMTIMTAMLNDKIELNGLFCSSVSCVAAGIRLQLRNASNVLKKGRTWKKGGSSWNWKRFSGS